MYEPNSNFYRIKIEIILPLFEISSNWTHPVKKVNIVKLISFLNNEDLRSIKQI